MGELLCWYVLFAWLPFCFSIDHSFRTTIIHRLKCDVPVDLSFIIHWVGRLSMQPWCHSLLQVGTGAAPALFFGNGKMEKN